MDTAWYLSRVGLPADLGGDDLAQAHAMVQAAMKDARSASVPSTPRALKRLYQYQVPKMSADGSCSLHGELEDQPYLLDETLGGASTATTMGLLALDTLVDTVQRQIDTTWLGLYQARSTPRGEVLVKICARGKPSRAEFPLTPDFSTLSNNVAVAFSGKARVIDDVRVHARSGGAYYECDPSIRAEACLPILNAQGQVLGVIDAESATSGYFIPRRAAWLVALAMELDGTLPPGGLLLTPQA